MFEVFETKLKEEQVDTTTENRRISLYQGKEFAFLQEVLKQELQQICQQPQPQPQPRSTCTATVHMHPGDRCSRPLHHTTCCDLWLIWFCVHLRV